MVLLLYLFSFYKDLSKVGSDAGQVDFVIDLSSFEQTAIISRCHAIIFRHDDNRHVLHDVSLNGVFVDNVKISGKLGRKFSCNHRLNGFHVVTLQVEENY